jgi:hypothetical protein
MISHALEGACAFAWRTYLLHKASTRTITDVPLFIGTSRVFVMPVSVISMSCKWPRYLNEDGASPCSRRGRPAII